MNTIILDTIMRGLDAFPILSAKDRSAIFKAYDMAPDQPVDTLDDDAWEAYAESSGCAAWAQARDTPLAVRGRIPNLHVLTLDEAMGYGSAPTKREVLMALSRAAERCMEEA